MQIIRFLPRIRRSQAWQSQVDDLTSQITDAKNSEEESANKLESYDKLLTAYETYTTGDIEKAEMH